MKKGMMWSLSAIFFLMAALCPVALLGQNEPQTPQLAGTWTAHIPAKNWSHGGYRIIQNGQDLTYIIWSGEKHNGRVLGAGAISYVQTNATGRISGDGNRIDWTGGSYWIRDVAQTTTTQQPIQVSGVWTAYVPAKNWSRSGYQIIQNGENLTYKIPNNPDSTGRVLSQDTISYADGIGKLSNGGSRIDWNNGTYWIRQQNVTEKPPSVVRASLTGAWVHSADRNTVTPNSYVIIIQDGDRVTKINSYKPFPNRPEWQTLSCVGPLTGNRITFKCNWAPGGDPNSFGPPKGASVPWPEVYDVSPDGNHLNGVGTGAQWYSRKP